MCEFGGLSCVEVSCVAVFFCSSGAFDDDDVEFGVLEEAPCGFGVPACVGGVEEAACGCSEDVVVAGSVFGVVCGDGCDGGGADVDGAVCCDGVHLEWEL